MARVSPPSPLSQATWVYHWGSITHLNVQCKERQVPNNIIVAIYIFNSYVILSYKLLFYKTTKRIHLRFKKKICTVLRRKVLINKSWRVLLICPSFMIRMITKSRALWSLYLTCLSFNIDQIQSTSVISVYPYSKMLYVFYTDTKKHNN